jgi:hypothetical protein
MLTRFVSLLRKHWPLFALQFLWIVGIWLLRESRDWMIADHVELKLVVVVPDNIPESVPGHNKGGDSVTLKLKEHYAYDFANGWSECLESFLKPQHPGFNPYPVDPFDESRRPRLKQIYGYYYMYQTDGFTDCRKQLAALSRAYGTSTVRRILRQKYGFEWEAIRQSVDRLKEAT